MEPISRGKLHEQIECAVVTFIDTGETQTLATRDQSVCHFFSPFMVGKDQIQLRLDWSDLDSDGRPTLDADFLNPETGKSRSLKGELKEAHHTGAMPGEGRRYEWAFKAFSREFSVAITWIATISEIATATDYCSAEIIRGLDR
jgi:hypothetical protein